MTRRIILAAVLLALASAHGACSTPAPKAGLPPKSSAKGETSLSPAMQKGLVETAEWRLKVFKKALVQEDAELMVESWLELENIFREKDRFTTAAFAERLDRCMAECSGEPLDKIIEKVRGLAYIQKGKRLIIFMQVALDDGDGARVVERHGQVMKLAAEMRECMSGEQIDKIITEIERLANTALAKWREQEKKQQAEQKSAPGTRAPEKALPN